MTHHLGIDIGGTSVKAACLSPAGDVLGRDRWDMQGVADDDWPERIAEGVAAMQRGHGGAAATVGVSAPGIAAPDESGIWWMMGRLELLMAVDWPKLLDRDVAPVINDAQAALLGEARQGAARGARHAAMLTLGTGVGGAAMVDGHLLRGAVGRAGHLGHICLDPEGEPDIVNTPGSLEEAIGNCTIERRTAGRWANSHALVAAVRDGDDEADRIWRTSVRALACGVASIINVLDPEVIVIGGGIAAAGNLLFDPLRAELDRVEWRPHGHRVRIAPAELGEFAGAIGAAANAMEPAQGPPEWRTT